MMMNLRDLKTVTIKPGTFLLGSQIQREPRTKVIITRGFDMLTTPVTGGLSKSDGRKSLIKGLV